MAKTWEETVMNMVHGIGTLEAVCQVQAELTWHARDQEVAEAEQRGIQKVVESLLTDGLLEVGRKAIEDMLVEWRDARLSEFNRGNGLVIRERDGRDSDVIRFGSETALRIGIKAMLQAQLKAWGIKQEE
jgi:hypothetical protein